MADRGSYPHPVLDNFDDVSSTFEATNTSYGATIDDIEITYEVRTDDPDVLTLIEDGLARHSLSWSCTATIAAAEVTPKTVKKTADGVLLRTWIDHQRVSGDVDVDVRVVATREMPTFRWTNQHPDYGDASFPIEVGDVIAEGGAFTVNAEKSFDPLSPPVGSCFEFVRAHDVPKGIRVDFAGDDAVQVRLASRVADGLEHMRSRPDRQIALVVLPALMETLEYIRADLNSETPEGANGRRWYEAVEEMAAASGGFDQRMINLAQKILANPLDRVMKTDEEQAMQEWEEDL